MWWGFDGKVTIYNGMILSKVYFFPLISPYRWTVQNAGAALSTLFLLPVLLWSFSDAWCCWSTVVDGLDIFGSIVDIVRIFWIVLCWLLYDDLYSLFGVDWPEFASIIWLGLVEDLGWNGYIWAFDPLWKCWHCLIWLVLGCGDDFLTSYFLITDLFFCALSCLTCWLLCVILILGLSLNEPFVSLYCCGCLLLKLWRCLWLLIPLRLSDAVNLKCSLSWFSWLTWWHCMTPWSWSLWYVIDVYAWVCMCVICIADLSGFFLIYPGVIWVYLIYWVLDWMMWYLELIVVFAVLMFECAWNEWPVDLSCWLTEWFFYFNLHCIVWCETVIFNYEWNLNWVLLIWLLHLQWLFELPDWIDCWFFINLVMIIDRGPWPHWMWLILTSWSCQLSSWWVMWWLTDDARRVVWARVPTSACPVFDQLCWILIISLLAQWNCDLLTHDPDSFVSAFFWLTDE